MSKDKDKNKKPQEHPQFQMQMMSDTMDSVTAVAQKYAISHQEAAVILLLNELRCIHWHIDEWDAGIMTLHPHEEPHEEPK